MIKFKKVKLMHEYTIVSSLIELCEKEAKKLNTNKIKTVTLQIGKLSGIETHFLKNSFDFFKKNTICHNAELVIKDIDVKIHCKNCNHNSIISKNNFFCPICNSKETEIVQGQEMIIESLEILKD